MFVPITSSPSSSQAASSPSRPCSIVSLAFQGWGAIHFLRSTSTLNPPNHHTQSPEGEVQSSSSPHSISRGSHTSGCSTPPDPVPPPHACTPPACPCPAPAPPSLPHSPIQLLRNTHSPDTRQTARAPPLSPLPLTPLHHPHGVPAPPSASSSPARRATRTTACSRSTTYRRTARPRSRSAPASPSPPSAPAAAASPPAD